jgi:hypothetical protein
MYVLATNLHSRLLLENTFCYTKIALHVSIEHAELSLS